MSQGTKTQYNFWDSALGTIQFGAASIAAMLAGAVTALATGVLTVTGDVIFAANAAGSFNAVKDTVATGITAGTTHTLAGATALTASVNYLATVANASDAVALPAATAAMVGKRVKVFNDGTHVAAVWPQAADAIDGGSAGVAVALTNALRCEYYYKAVNVITSAQMGAVSA